MIHNVGILAHVDSGKTTLTEQILFTTGALRRLGSVDSGTTATDSMAVERARGISVRSATASTVYKDTLINLIDTPGHVDFAGEVERSLLALDYAVLLVSAVEGVRAHTEALLKALDAMRLPCLVFINKIDRNGTNIQAVLASLHEASDRVPILLTETNGEEIDTPSVRLLDADTLAARVTEAFCDSVPEAEEAFLADTVLSHDRAKTLLAETIADCKSIPVLTGSAKLGIGTELLLDTMLAYMPSSEHRGSDTLSGVIFKIEHDDAIGKIAHVRLFGGKIENRDEVTLISEKRGKITDEDTVAAEEAAPPKEKISQIRKFNGAKYSDSGIVTAGDVAALCGLSSAKTGQFIGSVTNHLPYRLATPFLRVKVTPTDPSPDAIPALAAALSKLSDEEPYLSAQWENGQREIIIHTTGKIQLEIIDTLLAERFGIRATFSPPTVIYKETPSKKGIAYADYTMPKPCWAVVKFEFEPMPRGYGVSYHGTLPSNQCFYRYQTHIRRSFEECLEQGLYGWEVTDFKCTLVGGEHHTIHTHPLDFFVCTPMAFMNGLQSLGTTILEPLLKLTVTAPCELYGKILSEIIRMGGEVDAPATHKEITTIEAIVPAATSMEFPQRLASLSSGRAALSTAFYGYRECRDGLEHISPRRGVNPLDRSKWILWARGAYTLGQN